MKKNGPWTIKSSEMKYKSPWIEVREDQVIRPDGKDGIYSTIFIGATGVVVLPIDEDNNVYLLKEFAYGLGEVHIAVIAGGAEDSEDPLEAAKREAREEAGIEASRWTSLGHGSPLTSYMKHVHYFFLAEDLMLVNQETESTETIEPYRVPFKQAIEMVMSGEIQSELACLVLLKAEKFLRERGV
jgi:8-oxo-dGTP pyrophosphatase MutT (NUDIX family)